MNGTHLLMICPKGRLVIPQGMRQMLGSTIGLTVAPNLGLLLFPASQAPALAVELAEMPHGDLLRAVAHLAPVNGEGRVLIPAHLRQLCNFTPGAEVAITGLGSCAVVMRSEAWDARVCAAVALFWGQFMGKAPTLRGAR
jgi:DNA-binding transcriptional regulator/RsmH inhibitor MraZ